MNNDTISIVYRWKRLSKGRLKDPRKLWDHEIHDYVYTLNDNFTTRKKQ